MPPDEDVSQKERWTAVNGEADAYIKIECRLDEDKEKCFYKNTSHYKYWKLIICVRLSLCDKFRMSQLVCVISGMKM